MIRTQAHWVALVSTIACSTVALGQELDAPAYVARVLAEGPESRVAEAQAALTRAESVGVGRWPNPTLDWQRQSMGGGPNNGAQDLFLASLPLVISGRLGLESAAAALRAEAGGSRLARARALLHRDALDRFHQALAANQRRVVYEDSLAVVDQLLQVITARQKAGEASGYDLLRIGVERAALETARAEAVLLQDRALAEARALLPAGTTPVTLSGSLPTHVRVDDWKALETRRADLKAFELEARAADADRRAAGRGWIPEPVISGGAQTFGLGLPGPTAGYVVGASIPLPLFQHRSGEQAQAAARAGLAHAQRVASLHSAQLLAEATLNEVTARAAQLERQQRDVLPRAEQLRQVASTAYRGGAAELLVLVDAERAAREVRLTTIELQLKLAVAHTALLFLSGTFDAAPDGVAP